MSSLHGIRVLELGSFITGPYAAMLLGDLGADVVKIETPSAADPFRSFEGEEMSSHFEAYNRNKRSLALDTRATEGRAILLRLVADADCIIFNQRPTAIVRHSLDYETLSRVNRRLVACYVTGFGADGPAAERPAFDNVGQALSGWSSRFRVPGGDARVAGPAVSDAVTGLFAALGIVAALAERGTHGPGRMVEVNMLAATMAFAMEPFAGWFHTGRPVPVYGRGAASQAYTVTCRDGRRLALHLSSPPKFWEQLCAAIERDDWIARYSNRADRVADYELIADELSVAFSKKTRDEWIARLSQFDVPFAPEHELGDVESDPQVVHLGLVAESASSDGTRFRTIRSPLQFDHESGVIAPPPRLGEHSRDVLTECGLTADEVDDLVRAGVVAVAEQPS